MDGNVRRAIARVPGRSPRRPRFFSNPSSSDGLSPGRATGTLAAESDAPLNDALKEKQRESPLMFGLGPTELIVLAVIVLLLFGSRLPSVMRSLGSSIVSFKKGMKEGEEEERKHLDSQDQNH